MRAVWVSAAVAIVAWALLGASPVCAAPGVVRGTKALKVRRGPGTQYPAFAHLQQGDRVEVAKVEGAWASVRTPGGATGYVRKEYLSLSAGLPSREPAPAPPERPQGTAAQTAAAGSAAAAPEKLSELDARNAQLEAQVSALREQLAKAEAAAPTPAPTGGTQPALTVDIQNDLKRLIRLTEELHAQAGVIRSSPSQPLAAADSDEHHLATSAWLLIVGVLFGGVAGSAYGRQQERRRRTRVRF